MKQQTLKRQICEMKSFTSFHIQYMSLLCITPFISDMIFFVSLCPCLSLFLCSTVLLLSVNSIEMLYSFYIFNQGQQSHYKSTVAFIFLWSFTTVWCCHSNIKVNDKLFFLFKNTLKVQFIQRFQYTFTVKSTFEFF